MSRYYEKSIIEQEIEEMRRGKDLYTWEETKRNIREARYRLSLRTESFISHNGNVGAAMANHKVIGGGGNGGGGNGNSGTRKIPTDTYVDDSDIDEYTIRPSPPAANGGSGGEVDRMHYLSAAKLTEESSIKMMSP